MKSITAGAAFFALLFLFVPGLALPQSAIINQAGAALDEGIARYGDGDFAGSLSSFSKVLADPKAGDSLPEAYYWSALCYLSLGDYDAAEKAAEFFQANYPKSPRTADIQYQRGRISYLKREYEKAIKIFQVYLESYPNADLRSSALYWSAESLFQLGQFESAEKIFQALLDTYPNSVKREAASYRLSIIDMKYREDELLTLLKWSHEESLKTVEEFQRREKTYEQAINALQKKVTETTRDSRIAELEKQVTELSAEALASKRSLTDRDATIASLNAKLSGKPQALDSDKASQAQANREAALNLKEEALSLQEYYLTKLSEIAGSITK